MRKLVSAKNVRNYRRWACRRKARFGTREEAQAAWTHGLMVYRCECAGFHLETLRDAVDWLKSQRVGVSVDGRL